MHVQKVIPESYLHNIRVIRQYTTIQRIQTAIYALTTCPQDYNQTTPTSERVISDTAKSVRIISNRKLAHTAKRNQYAPNQTCPTAELTHTATKAAQASDKPKQPKVEW